MQICVLLHQRYHIHVHILSTTHLEPTSYCQGCGVLVVLFLLPKAFVLSKTCTCSVHVRGTLWVISESRG